MKKSALDRWVCRKEGLSELKPSDIQDIQLRKLNRLLERERNRSGFYRELPVKISSLEELEKLPFTTEEDLKRCGNSMVLVSQSQIQRVRTQQTSGTTGPAKRVYYAEEDNERTVSFFAAGLSELIFEGNRTMICMPFSGERGLGEMIAEAVECLGADPVPAGDCGSFADYLELMNRSRPEVYVGPPVLLLSLLRLQPEHSLRRALVSGDACPDGVMEEIEKLLDSRLYPHYGSREIGLGGAVTCPAFHGMHLRENDLLAEIVDERGKPLPRGEWGELAITTLEAKAMPLIRYRTGDRARFLPEACPCGSCLVRLDRVSRSGEEGAMEKLDDRLFRFPEVVDYRAVKEKGGLRIEGVLKGRQAGFPAVWGEMPLQFRWREVSRRDEPCYRGKRRILTES